jgi:hypothetical protein
VTQNGEFVSARLQPCRKERKELSPRASKGAIKLQFKIKGQDYFLAFVEQEKRWYVFAPTPQGVHRIPVYMDGAKHEKLGILGTETTLSS